MKIRASKAGRTRRLGALIAVIAASLTVLGIVVAARGSETTASDAELLREQIDAHYKELQAQGLADPAPKPADPQALAPSPEPEKWPEGIFDDGEYPSSEYAFENRWSGIVNGQDVVVYAGSFSDDSKAGLVLVWSRSEDYDVTTTQYPSGIPGPLKIQSEKDQILTLSNEAGDVATFDVPTGKFVKGGA